MFFCTIRLTRGLKWGISMSTRSRRKWLCMDCKQDTGRMGEHYMLVDATWQLAHNSNKGMLCVGCIEKRLGRKLRHQDFNDSHVNRISPGGSKSQRLLQRMA